MNRALWTSHRTAALLAGLLVTLTAMTPVRAYEPALEPDLAWVPPDATAFVTVRVAELADKLGIKATGAKHPWAVAWQNQTGIPLSQVERCTFVNPKDDAYSSCLVILTTKPYKRAEVLKACAPDAQEEKHYRKVCLVSSTKKTAIHFATDRILLVGDTDAVVRCLGQATKPHPGGTLIDALVSVGSHDVVVWSRAATKDNDPAPPRAVPATSSYKVPLTAPNSLGRTVTVARKPKLSAAFEDGSQPRASEQMTELGFLPIPLPVGVESGTVTVDVGEQLTVELRLHCTDEACATKSAKVLRAFVGMARAELLAVVSELDMIEAFPAMTSREEKACLPMKLIRQAEKGLQDARVRTDGNTVPLRVSISVDTKILRSEMAPLMKLSESCGNGNQCSLLPLFKQLVQGRSAPSGPWQDAPTTVDPLISPVAPLPTYPGIPATPPLSPGVEVPQQPTFQVKLTVANVRKEPALLFTIGDDSKLTFVQKVPAGEAVDVQTNSGQSWVAVFMERPGGEIFKPSQAKETWLLRAEPRVVAPPVFSTPATTDGGVR